MMPSYVSDPIDDRLEQEAGPVDATAVKALTRVFRTWRIGISHAAKLVGVSDRTWSRMKDEAWTGSLNADQRLRASAIIGIYKGLHLYFGDDLADRWVRMPNNGPLFHGMTPIELMERGGIVALLDVRNYIDAVRGGM